ncbi:aspartate/glutamate racemase family protein [Candidatus Formimonas warabiya]|uniref:Hydantoin racemase n=1 Tax=Formimonas warabiya TaxID=1761012 RepID=A0A3G1KQ95_FORW1|nr:aspartate/glutamate racemase family protein [Candidatus Formimonas warabiya]ATW24642.1 hypothetical protein DCMF_07485 [Candidatus Formimonas warabiya]
MSKIAYIDPIGPEGATPLLIEELKKITGNGDAIEYFHLDRGPLHLEYRYYESVIIPDLLHLIKKLDDNNYDACVIGCFYDPGLYAAREIVKRAVVTAPAESSFSLATLLGHKFSVLVGREKHIPRMMENIQYYGYKERLASFKSLNLGVLDFHADEAKTIGMLKQKAKEAVEVDGAEVIILGCTMQVGFYEELQKYLDVPVIDPVIAAVKYAGYLREMRDRFNWKTSRVKTFEAPPEREIAEWNLSEKYRCL